MTTTPQPGSERSFGVVFTIVFTIIALYPLLNGNEPFFIVGGLATLTLVITLVRPSLLKTPNILWFKFGLALGSVVSPVVLFLIYLTTLFPIGLIWKVVGKDPLRLKKPMPGATG